jgi:hypothetical protein
MRFSPLPLPSFMHENNIRGICSRKLYFSEFNYSDGHFTMITFGFYNRDFHNQLSHRGRLYTIELYQPNNSVVSVKMYLRLSAVNHCYSCSTKLCPLEIYFL